MMRSKPLMSWMLCWRASRRGQRARGVACGTRGSRSKSCAEVMPRKMVRSKVPLRSKLHNMVGNMVIVEQSKRQSIAARSIRKRGVATCGRKRCVCLANALARLADVMCGVMGSNVAAMVICCCNSALHCIKQGMWLAAHAQHGVVLSRRRFGWCACARLPPAEAVAPGAVRVCASG